MCSVPTTQPLDVAAYCRDGVWRRCAADGRLRLRCIALTVSSALCVQRSSHQSGQPPHPRRRCGRLPTRVLTTRSRSNRACQPRGERTIIARPKAGTTLPFRSRTVPIPGSLIFDCCSVSTVAPDYHEETQGCYNAGQRKRGKPGVSPVAQASIKGSKGKVEFMEDCIEQLPVDAREAGIRRAQLGKLGVLSSTA